MTFHQEIAAIEKFVGQAPFFLSNGPKRDDLVDAIYMSAKRSCTSLLEVLPILKTSEAFREEFFEATNGNIYSYVREDLRPLAMRIFHKIAGGGTPNAAMGKGELLLLLFPEKTSKPAAGDIAYQDIEIEVKANSGKVGVGSCRDGNEMIVKFCENRKIDLPKSKFGRHAINQPKFSPNLLTHRNKFPKNHLREALSVWWEAISKGERLENPTWEDVRRAFLKKVAEQQISSKKWLLVLDDIGNFQLFRDHQRFVKYYDNDSAGFEYRAHHRVPFSIYLEQPTHEVNHLPFSRIAKK